MNIIYKTSIPKLLVTWLTAIVMLLGSAATFTLPAQAATTGEVTVAHPYTKATYMGSTAFTTPAAATADMFQLFGSSTKTVKILWIALCYQGTTPGTTTDQVFLVKRSTANSGGTAGTTTVTPVDSNNAASTAGATCKVYTANPTPGTLLGQLAAYNLCAYFPPAGTGTVSAVVPTLVLFDARLAGQPITLRGTAEGVCVNFNGVIPSATTPKLAFNIIWTEE